MNRCLSVLICLDVIYFCYSFTDNYGIIKRQVGSAREKYKDHVPFDLAEFIRTEKNKDETGTGPEQNYMSPYNDNINTDYLNINDDNIRVDNDYLDDINNDKTISKNLKDLLFMEEKDGHNDKESLIDDDREMLVAVHNPEKKCSFQHIPFFSHSTSTTKSRKSKKKKINSKGRLKSSTKTEMPDTETLQKTPKNFENKHEKRFSHKFLPFGGNNKKEKMVHNSRQYYKSIDSHSTTVSNLIKATDSILTRKDNLNVDYDSFVQEDNRAQDEVEESEEDYRSKRDETEEREKRLRMLDELERKVQGVQINSLITKPSGPPN